MLSVRGILNLKTQIKQKEKKNEKYRSTYNEKVSIKKQCGYINIRSCRFSGKGD